MKHSKKMLSLALALSMSFGLVACGSPAPAPTPSSSADASASTPAEGTVPSGSLVVYSPHDADPLNDGVNMFMEAYPEIQVEVVAAGTGELTNRIKAEAAKPIADVLWGGGADSLAAFKDLFAPYVCANDEFISDSYKDKDDMWIGESPLPMVIFYNKELLAEDGIEAPESWEALLDPALKGKIAYCLPSKSGSAYTQLITMILGKEDKEAGWAFMEDLLVNLDGKLVDSSSKCHKMVSDGEYSVGLTLEKAAVQYNDVEHVGFLYPTDGTSAVPDGIALVKNAPNEENAKLFIDFMTSFEVQEAQSQRWGRRPVRSDVPVPDGMAPLTDIPLVDYDFDWAANEKEQTIEKFNDLLVSLY